MSYEFRGQTRAKTEAERNRGRSARPSRTSGTGATLAPASPPVTEPAPARAPTSRRSLMQILAAVMGATFLLAGLGGFIPGITSNYDQLAFAGTESQAKLLGLFEVSVVHNIVHLLFGVGLLAAARYTWARAYLFAGGVIYLALTVFGFVIDRSSDVNFVPINSNDNYLHLGLSLALLLFGVIGLRAARSAPAR